MKHYSSGGSICKRSDGRWEARYMDLDGSRHSMYGRTKSEVQKRLISTLNSVQEGALTFSPITSVEDLCDRWLEYVACTVRTRTFVTYSYIVKIHIKPHIGNVPVRQLTVLHVQNLLNDLRSGGLSPRSVVHVRAVLRTALNQAIRLDLVSRNVAQLASPPRLDENHSLPLTVAESRAVLSCVRDTDLECIITLAISLGLRQGEILGLRWTDVDFDKGHLHVRNALCRTAGSYVLAQTKTAKSQRMLALPAGAVASLQRHKVRQRKYRTIAQNEWQEEIPDLVFTTFTGRPLHSSTIHHQFNKVLDLCNLPRRPFHALRHTAATLALGQGVDLKTVSTMLGHSQISLTANTYATTLPSLLVEAAIKINDLLRDDGDVVGDK